MADADGELIIIELSEPVATVVDLGQRGTPGPPGPPGPPGGTGDPVLVLGPNDPVPPGTAPGTVIVRPES